MVYVYDFTDDLSYTYTNELSGRNNTWRNNLYRHGMERRKIYDQQSFPWSEIVYNI
jgi:hypothetical protein